jgi:hypothetical protein
MIVLSFTLFAFFEINYFLISNSVHLQAFLENKKCPGGQV